MIQIWHVTADNAQQIELPRHSSFDEITRQLPDGFYSTFRTYGQGTHVIGLKAHLQRLYQPVRSPETSEGTLREYLRILLKDYPHEARVRVMMTKQGQVFVAIEALQPLPRAVYENGVRVETIRMQRKTPRLKSTAFISASLDERKHIAREGILEALMVKNGRILEGMTSNFFYTLRPAKSPKGERSGAKSHRPLSGKGKFQKQPIYPRDSHFDYGADEHSPSAPQESAGTSQREMLCTAQRDILLGVTRRTVIRVARGMGLEVRYLPLRQDQLEVAREAFITSSSRGIVPVVRIDNVTVGEGRVGPITRKLSAAYEAYVMGKAEEI